MKLPVSVDHLGSVDLLDSGCFVDHLGFVGSVQFGSLSFPDEYKKHE